MRILVVVSGNHRHVAPFVSEQVEALRRAGCEVRLFAVEGHGIRGYLHNLNPLKAAIGQFQPAIVHAHYSLCGLLCTLQHNVPVVVTYHGSDINNRHLQPFSRLSMRRAAYNIFVSNNLLQKASHGGATGRSTVLPCGVNMNDFPVVERLESRRRMNLHPDGRYVLFAGAFDDAVKNAPLAQAACALLPEAEQIELKGYTREEVAMLMNAADALLMTSFSEGSPQVVKEAMSVGLPIVTVDVGDVKELFGNTNSGAVAARTPEALAAALQPLLTHPFRTDGRKRIADLQLDNEAIAAQLIAIYRSICM